MNQKTLKTIRKYAKVIGINEKYPIRAFEAGDVFQKKRDLIAMRCTIYIKEHGHPGMTPREKILLIEEFMKTEPGIDKVDFKLPKIKSDPWLD